LACCSAATMLAFSCAKRASNASIAMVEIRMRPVPNAITAASHMSPIVPGATVQIASGANCAAAIPV